jgi:hypothetical protein
MQQIGNKIKESTLQMALWIIVFQNGLLAGFLSNLPGKRVLFWSDDILKRCSY